MAHKKAGGSTRNGRDSNPKYLGIKCFGGQQVQAGSIIVRQRGTKFHPGMFVGKGKDDTLYAKVAGHVQFGIAGKKQHRVVTVIPAEQEEAAEQVA